MKQTKPLPAFMWLRASLVAQLVKNLSALWETWVQSLGCEDPLEKGKATNPSILAWRIPWTVQSMKSQSDTYIHICMYMCRDMHRETVLQMSRCLI